MTGGPLVTPGRGRRHEDPTMTTSRRLVAGTLVVLLALGSIAVITELSGHYQVLPFSTWSLFSRMPERERVDYGVRILSIDGVEQTPPVYFESSDLPDASSPAAYELVRDVGLALEDGDQAEADQIWSTFAGRYLGGIDAEVEIVRRRYDVIDSRTCDCYLDETVIETREVQR
jgi:hypothetical protein